MPDALILGLPRAVRQPFDSFANAFELDIARTYAQVGEKGSFVLLPKPEHCILDIQRYLLAQQGSDYSNARVLVLPYAELPAACIDELQIAEEMGASVRYVDVSTDSSWPKHSRRHKADKFFYDSLVRKLHEYLISLDDPDSAPSLFIERLALASGRLLIADNALDTCDDIAPWRYEFMRRATLTLLGAVSNGLSTRFDQYCDESGLQHAQSGGSTVTVKFYGTDLAKEDVVCNTHLKMGDKTTPQAAARLYYAFVDWNDMRYGVVLYAGTHPDGNFIRRVRLPND